MQPVPLFSLDHLTRDTLCLGVLESWTHFAWRGHAQLLSLTLPGAGTLVAATLALAAEEGATVHLEGPTPLTPDQRGTLRRLMAAGLEAGGDDAFREYLLLPADESPLTVRSRTRPPAQSWITGAAAEILDEAENLLEDLALPAPRRFAAWTREPFSWQRVARERHAEIFQHFLDADGSWKGLIHHEGHPPPAGLAAELYRQAPDIWVAEEAPAALAALVARFRRKEEDAPDWWTCVYCDGMTVTAYLLRKGRIRAGFCHEAALLNRDKLADALLLLAAGADLDAEIRLDGGWWAASRLISGEVSDGPVLLAGEWPPELHPPGAFVVPVHPALPLPSEGMLAL